jgi:CHAT domain-containing protein/tetratricopeptide (TPR) repeat protein
MNVLELLNRTEEELKVWARSQPTAALYQTFDEIWQQIRNAHLYAGQPRSTESERGSALARVCLKVATELADEHLLVLAWRMLAYSLTANEQYEESLPHYERVLRALDEADDASQAARVRLGYIAALFHTGRYREALDVSAVAEDWFKANNDEIGFARLCNNIANLYDRLDEHAIAYRYQQQHSEIVRKLGDQEGLAKSYLNLANTLAAMDQFERADEMYANCEELSRQLGITELEIQASYNRGHLYFLRGRYTDAFEAFSHLRQHFERSGSRRHSALCDLDEAEMYIQLNLAKDASALALRASEQFKELGLNYEQAKSLTFRGLALFQMKQYPAALSTFQTAQKMFESEGNLYWMALLDLYRSEVELSLKRYAEARAFATQAKARFERMGVASKTTLSLVNIGRIALALNDIPCAESAAAEIAALIQTTSLPLLLFPCYVLFAEIAERKKDWNEAERFYTLTAADLEVHQARLHHDDLRVTFFKGKQLAYEGLVQISLRNADRHEAIASAYIWSERAKSRGLIELLSQHLPTVHAHAEPSLLAKIEQLREELNVLYAKSRPEVTVARPSSILESIAAKEDELARSLREASIRDPEYTSLQQASVATIESVQQALPDYTTLVEYFIARNEVLVFLISRSGAEVHRHLCSGDEILGIQKRLAFHLEEFMLGDAYLRSHSDQNFQSTQHYLAKLYRMLFAPIAGRIRTPHVTIIPHGYLHLLPFHAFADGSQYLIDRFDVSYAPSASVLKLCLEKEDLQQARGCVIGLADTTAPFVEQEVRDLASMLPGSTLLLNSMATRTAFAEAARRTSFLHIATHGIFRQDNPMFSGFKLADGWVTALDLFSTTCETNLVTLSGCKSGVSQVTGSDDLVGLMRGFLYSGARSLMLSLWNIDDECTSKLMARFYGSWRKGATRSAALSTAMKELRQDYPNPFYWAPFLLVGKQ